MHVDSLIKKTMKKGVFDIKLMNKSVMSNADIQNSLHRCNFDNKTEGLVVIDTLLLRLSIR